MAAVEAKRKPRWLLTPGAPPEPNHAEFGREMRQLVEKRRGLIDRIKELQASVQRRDGEGGDEGNEERRALRERLAQLEATRRAEREKYATNHEEMAKMRRERRAQKEQHKALINELGGFQSPEEIDEAMTYLVRKMETAGGGLAAEKRTVRQLQQLEEAKSLFARLQPLSTILQKVEMQELKVQQESREIQQRLDEINSEYEEQRKTKTGQDVEAKKDGAVRADVYKKCDAIRQEINAIDATITAGRAEHQKITEEWEAWKVGAREKYMAQQEQRRLERHQEYLARKNATKLQEKLERAKQRQNPHEAEIGLCSTLSQDLRNLVYMLERTEKEREKAKALESFDSSKAVPEGCTVLNTGTWSKPGDAKNGKKKQQQQQASGAQEKKDGGTLQYTAAKLDMYRQIEVEPPKTAEDITKCLERISARQRVYESKIVHGEPVLSSDDDEEAEEAEEAEAPEEENGNERAPAGDVQRKDGPSAPLDDGKEEREVEAPEEEEEEQGESADEHAGDAEAGDGVSVASEKNDEPGVEEE